LYVLSHLFLEAKKPQLISKSIDFYSGNSRLDLATDTFSVLSWTCEYCTKLELDLRQQERLRKRCKETTTTSTADELLQTTNHGKLNEKWHCPKTTKEIIVSSLYIGIMARILLLVNALIKGDLIIRTESFLSFGGHN
jgi:hypothetical protein